MKKTLFFIHAVVLIISEIIWLLMNKGFMTIVSYKQNLTKELLLADLKNSLFSPIQTASGLIAEKNPLYIIGAIALLFYIGFFAFKHSTNNSDDWSNSKKGTHGTAHWGTFKELVNDGNYKYIRENRFYEQWKSTVNWEVGEDE